MEKATIKVIFEFTDAHMSINDDRRYIDDIEQRCIQLCQIFDFEYNLIYKRLDLTPNLVFSVSFFKNVLSTQHYMNVLAAFAQEFQILIANAQEI